MSASENITVSEQLRGGLNAHLEQCAACQAVLHQLSSGNETLPTFTTSDCPLVRERARDASTVHDLPRDHRHGAGAEFTVFESSTALEKHRGAGATHQFPEPPLQPGDVGSVGCYEVKAKLAVGGMSTVYIAEDSSSGRQVALKVLNSWVDTESAAQKRMQREAEAAKRVRHPNVIAVYDLLLRDGLPPTVVMELLSGNTLRNLLRQESLLPSTTAATLLCGAARGVAACHAAGVIHRDIKPSNLLAEVSEGGTQLVVSDFGIARDCWRDEALTQTGGLLGTPAYMSPEQIQTPADADARSDVYSLGCVLYEMLTGRPPFLGSVRMLLWQATHDIPRSPRELNENVDRALDTICLKALASSPGQRYQTAEEFADDLDRYLTGKPIHASPAGPIRRILRSCQRNAVRSTALASLFLLLTGISAVSLFAANRMADARRVQTEAMNKAITNEQIAKQQSQLAFDTLTQVINDVEQGLQRLPAGSPIRQNLLETSIENLTRVADSFIDRSSIDLETARAMYKLAQLLLRFGDSGQAGGVDPDSSAAVVAGSEGGSRDHFQVYESLVKRAYEIAAEVAREDPSQFDAHLLASEMKGELGGQFYLRGELDRGQEALEIGIKSVRDLLKRNPNSESVARELVRQLSLQCQVYGLKGRLAEAHACLEESIETADKYFPVGMPSKGETDFLPYQHKLMQYALLASLSEKAGKTEEGMAALESAAKLSSALAAILDEVETDRVAAAGQVIANSYILMETGGVEASIEHAKKAAKSLEQAIEADPADIQANQWLELAYTQVAEGYTRLGEEQSAAIWTAKVESLSGSAPDQPADKAVEEDQ